MNNKAQLSVLAFMLAVVIVLLGLALAFPINKVTTGVMSDNATEVYGDNADYGSGMNCTGTGISDFTKAACWTVDITQFWFIGGLIALAGAVIGAKIIFG